MADHLLFNDVLLAGSVRIGGRKMGLEGAARMLDGGDKAVREFPLLEMPREERDEIVPPQLADFVVERGAAYDREFLRLGREENEQAVLGRRMFQPQLAELQVGRGEGIPHVTMADVKDDVRRRAVLGGLDRPVDAIVLQRAQKVFDFHGRSQVTTRLLRRRHQRSRLRR